MSYRCVRAGWRIHDADDGARQSVDSLGASALRADGAFTSRQGSSSHATQLKRGSLACSAMQAKRNMLQGR